MAWPAVADVKRRLGITTTGTDADVADALAAAIEQIERDTGRGVGTITVPSASLRAAAILLTVSIYKAPDAPHGVAAIFDTGGIYVASKNPHYQRLLVGERTRFPIA